MYPHFLYPFFGLVACRFFQVLVITNKTAMNIIEQVCPCGMIEYPLSIGTRVVAES